MTLQQVYLADDPLYLDHTISWWDPDSECTLLLARPSDEYGLWSEYLKGAEHSYRKHGVDKVLDIDALQRGGDTLLFFAALDPAGRVVAGVRAKGPLAGADDSHAVVEWRNQPGLGAVRKMINDRAPFGVLEMKSAWVTDDADRSRPLAKAIARSGSHSMSLTDVQFCMATAGDYVLNRWRSSGGVVAEHIPPTPYPDDRYRTRMMWWDRRTFTSLSEPEQLQKMLTEMDTIRRLSGSTQSAPDLTVNGALA